MPDRTIGRACKAAADAQRSRARRRERKTASPAARHDAPGHFQGTFPIGRMSLGVLLARRVRNG
jgi:hypothetical protein